MPAPAILFAIKPHFHRIVHHLGFLSCQKYIQMYHLKIFIKKGFFTLRQRNVLIYS